MWLPQAVERATRRQVVKSCRLVHFDFDTTGLPPEAAAACRLALRDAPVVVAGHRWLAAGNLISISGTDMPTTLESAPATFTTAGVGASIALAFKEQARVRGRRVTVYFQLFDDEWQPLDQPIVQWVGIMDQVIAQGDISEASFRLTAENLWVAAVRPRHGYYTDADQKARGFTDDDGLFGTSRGPTTVSVPW